MTIDQLQALPDAELNRLAAECMGWTIGRHDPHNTVFHIPPGRSIDWFIMNGEPWIELPTPTTDHNDAHRLLEEVERRGLTFKFDMALGDCLNLSDEQPAYYLVANASPRILAACAAWVLMKGKGE